MSSSEPILSFIIPIRNDAERLRRCLASIARTVSDVTSEVIVGDNGSTDASADVARAAGAIVLSLPDRPVAEVRNAAARTAASGLLAFVDADHELAPGWARAAVGVLNDSSVSAVGAQYHAPPDGTWVQRMYDRFRRHSPGQRAADWLPSGNLVVRRSMFEELGGFDVTLETCEDVDFCQRLTQAGGRLINDDALRSVHFGDPRTLRSLFFSELWRGRDNVRVTLRAPITLRSAPSLVIPIINLLAISSMVLGGMLFPFVGPWLVAGGAAVLATLTVLRAGLLWTAVPRDERGGRALVQALLVAFVYEAARALALVLRTGHSVRRKGDSDSHA